jgi:hypothetical protein
MIINMLSWPDPQPAAMVQRTVTLTSGHSITPADLPHEIRHFQAQPRTPLPNDWRRWNGK